jgi:hypothetical protein
MPLTILTSLLTPKILLSIPNQPEILVRNQKILPATLSRSFSIILIQNIVKKMATFSTSTHRLAFNSSYKNLEVRLTSNNSLVESYPLDGSGASTSLTVSGGNFVINTAADFSEYTHGIDVGAGCELGFPSSNRMGGIVVIDLRDINMTDGPQTKDILYQLDCTSFRIKFSGSTPALRLNFNNSGNCYTLI